jgi:hypothetical protein
MDKMFYCIFKKEATFMKIPKQKESKTQVTRREFLASCAGCAAGAVALSTLGASALFAAGNNSMFEKAKVKIIFAHPDPTKPNWPNIDYDFSGHIKEVKEKLIKKCPDIDFQSVTITSGSSETAHQILSADDGSDGYVIYLAGCLWGNLTETIATSGKPTIIVDHLFAGSGEFLTSYARVKREGHKVVAVSSSNFDDLVDAVQGLNCLKKLRQSTILVVGGEPDDQIRRTYGTTMKKVEFEEINAAYKKVKPADVKTWADRWIGEAEKVIEPSREEIEKSAAIYLAMSDLMKKYNAQGITVNCLGGVYSGKMVSAYPCLGFMQLDNDGLVGGCEADQRSAITKLLMTYLVGRPGFISDPVIDTSKNQIIYAHCVASTKVFGPKGPANPYHLRDHSEDHKGACNRSLMPLGKMTTTILFDRLKKQVILHQGTTVENVDEYRACRTKLAVEVKGDVYKLLNYWDEWGWHRVTFFGDLKRPVYNIAALLGFEVVEEA